VASAKRFAGETASLGALCQRRTSSSAHRNRCLSRLEENAHGQVYGTRHPRVKLNVGGVEREAIEGEGGGTSAGALIGECGLGHLCLASCTTLPGPHSGIRGFSTMVPRTSLSGMYHLPFAGSGAADTASGAESVRYAGSFQAGPSKPFDCNLEASCGI
jgi:hypothetical protein